jgi:hypothetical protein
MVLDMAVTVIAWVVTVWAVIAWEAIVSVVSVVSVVTVKDRMWWFFVRLYYDAS